MLSYERTGSGQPLVLVHGYLGSLHIFDKVITTLSQHFDCLRVELPGHGKSEVELDAYTVYEYANEIAKVLQAEKIDSCYILGHSLGGYIALAAYEQNTINISKMILAYTSEKADDAAAKQKRDKQQQTIQTDGVESYVDGIIKNFFAPNPTIENVQTATAIANGASVQGLSLALEAMKGRPDQTKLLPIINIPVLVIEGMHDAVVQPIETTNKHFEKVLTNSGHLGMLEDPEHFAQAIVTFLNK